jgi:hypothetical protein
LKQVQVNLQIQSRVAVLDPGLGLSSKSIFLDPVSAIESIPEIPPVLLIAVMEPPVESPLGVQAVSKSACFSDLGSPSKTILFPESLQVRQIGPTGTTASPVRVYASPKVIVVAVSPSVASPLSFYSSAMEEAPFVVKEASSSS